jgi:hypothetical protein
MAVIAVFGSASGYSSGIRITTARIAAFKLNVAIIQYLDLVLIFPPDSIIESSNMGASLVEKVLTRLDTAAFWFVPARASL